MKNVTLGGIMPVILIVAIIGGGYFFSYAQYQEYKASQETIKTAQAKLDDVTQAKNDLEGFLAEYRRSLDSQAMVDRALPPDQPDIPAALALLEDLANASGLGIDSLNGRVETGPLADAAEANSVKVVDFDVQVSGTYAELINFLLLLEQNLRISDVQGLSIQSGESTTLNFDMQVRMYYQN